ncbi:unnamed protein product [Protopolystoma xenopodis]|uniref:Uncharacterized protein n=1 Tax=Protopolystoma xenopodis TaxID=117903 RepID=A0A3S5AA96_9PLAT|nr:unnamed protein product [Protopolystoma xenopodis]
MSVDRFSRRLLTLGSPSTVVPIEAGASLSSGVPWQLQEIKEQEAMTMPDVPIEETTTKVEQCYTIPLSDEFVASDSTYELRLPSTENLLDEQAFEEAYARAVDLESADANLTPSIYPPPTDNLCSLASASSGEIASHASLKSDPFGLQKQSTTLLRHRRLAGYDVIQGRPEELYNVEEIEETLPDGSIVRRRTHKEEIAQAISYRDWKEGLGEALADENSIIKVETPEEITEVRADGLILLKSKNEFCTNHQS